MFELTPQFWALAITSAAVPLALCVASALLRFWWTLWASLAALLLSIASWGALIWLNEKAGRGPNYEADGVLVGAMVLTTAGGGVILGWVLSLVALGIGAVQLSSRSVGGPGMQQ